MIYWIVLFLSSAFAQECPHMAGRWSCKYRNSADAPFETVVEENAQGPFAVYRVQSPAEGVTELTTDNQERAVNPKIGQGTMRSRCAGGRVFTTFHLTGSRGERTLIEDQMYPERGGLVRIFRQISPPPGPNERVPSFSCKPVIPSRHR